VRGPQIWEEESALIRRLVAEGATAAEVAERLGRSTRAVHKHIAAAGGVPPRCVEWSPRRLSAVDREEISRGLAAGESFAGIARRLGRPTSTVSREVARNGGRRRYRSFAAQQVAWANARRAKGSKLARCERLRSVVEAKLALKWSPEQISRWLVAEFPFDPEMRVSHETIYQSLYVQGRGALRAELTKCLRTGRARRRSRHSRGEGAGKIPNMVMISERPAEVEDRAVPGHWEGDLIQGAHNRSAIGTLVERSTRYVMLFALRDGRDAEATLAQLTTTVKRLPEQLWASLTWDQGSEMARHAQFRIDTGIDVYFCDPHSPWQRGSNENTNGLLRQYFPKGTDLSVHTQEHLDAVARELNERPRKTLGWKTPAETLAELVASTA
jgi:IS30 family transposase